MHSDVKPLDRESTLLGGIDRPTCRIIIDANGNRRFL